MFIERKILENVPVGLFLVRFDAVLGTSCNDGNHDDCLEHGCMDNEPSYITEIDYSLNEVTKDNYLRFWQNVVDKDESWNCNPLEGDDTHDFRPRLFTSKKDAESHIEYTLNRFKNPSPWELFAKFE